MTNKAFRELLKTTSDEDLRKIAARYMQREGRGTFSTTRRLDMIYEECRSRSGGDIVPWLFLKMQGDAAADTARGYIVRHSINKSSRMNRMKKQELISLLGRAVPELDKSTEITAKLTNKDILSLYNFGANSLVSRVSGDSMIGAKIYDNDLLIVDPDATIENGNIIVAKVAGEPFVKRYTNISGIITLLSENPKYAPYTITNDTPFEIIGKVVRIVREVE
jgi:DNA polymerase V